MCSPVKWFHFTNRRSSWLSWSMAMRLLEHSETSWFWLKVANTSFRTCISYCILLGKIVTVISVASEHTDTLKWVSYWNDFSRRSWLCVDQTMSNYRLITFNELTHYGMATRTNESSGSRLRLRTRGVVCHHQPLPTPSSVFTDASLSPAFHHR